MKQLLTIAVMLVAIVATSFHPGLTDTKKTVESDPISVSQVLFDMGLDYADYNMISTSNPNTVFAVLKSSNVEAPEGFAITYLENGELWVSKLKNESVSGCSGCPTTTMCSQGGTVCWRIDYHTGYYIPCTVCPSGGSTNYPKPSGQ